MERRWNTSRPNVSAANPTQTHTPNPTPTPTQTPTLTLTYVLQESIGNRTWSIGQTQERGNSSKCFAGGRSLKSKGDTSVQSNRFLANILTKPSLKFVWNVIAVWSLRCICCFLLLNENLLNQKTTISYLEKIALLMSSAWQNFCFLPMELEKCWQNVNKIK